MDSYGKELILDLHGCNPGKFTRKSILKFFTLLCDKIGMEQHDAHFWDYENWPDEYEKAPIHLKGTSAIQFITTSNITIHTLDVLRKVFLNIFSCKDFDTDIVVSISEKHFEGKAVTKARINRI